MGLKKEILPLVHWLDFIQGFQQHFLAFIKGWSLFEMWQKAPEEIKCVDLELRLFCWTAMLMFRLSAVIMAGKCQEKHPEVLHLDEGKLLQHVSVCHNLRENTSLLIYYYHLFWIIFVYNRRKSAFKKKIFWLCILFTYVKQNP